MRFLRFFTEGDGVHLGLRREERIFDVTEAARVGWNVDVRSPLPFVSGELGLDRLRALAAGDGFRTAPGGALRLDAPLRDARKLLALAGNFRKHVVESGFADVEDKTRITPQIFMMPPSTALNAPGAAILIRPGNVFVDYEIELAVVIGRGGRDIPGALAMEHVFGYSILNDVSERRLNGRMAGRKVREYDPFFDWLAGKWFDGFAPMGPDLVTADEVADPHNLSIRLWVNGELRQNGNTAEMIFSIPEVISYVSSVLTLEPGDIIAMGTPEGVGMARGISLAPGDRVRGEVEGLGALENTVELCGGSSSSPEGERHG